MFNSVHVAIVCFAIAAPVSAQAPEPSPAAAATSPPATAQGRTLAFPTSVAPAAAPVGLLSIDFTGGGGVGMITDPSNSWAVNVTPLPRVGLGTRFHLGNEWRLGVDINGTYVPSVNYNGYFTPVAYGDVNANVVFGYRSDGELPVIFEVEAGPSYVFSDYAANVGANARLFLGAEVRFGRLALAVGPALGGGYAGGGNGHVLLLARPSFVVGN